VYEQVLGLLQDFTPRVQALPPNAAADLDLTGAQRFFDRGARGISELVRLRALAWFGVETTLAVAPNRMLATMVAATTTPRQPSAPSSARSPPRPCIEHVLSDIGAVMQWLWPDAVNRQLLIEAGGDRGTPPSPPAFYGGCCHCWGPLRAIRTERFSAAGALSKFPAAS
jgi:hypothetical protein